MQVARDDGARLDDVAEHFEPELPGSGQVDGPQTSDSFPRTEAEQAPSPFFELSRPPTFLLVDPDRTRLLSWLSVGSGAIILLLLIAGIVLYVFFIFFAIAAEGGGF